MFYHEAVTERISIMAFDKVIIPTEKELIIQQLEKKIISGELAAGVKLPTERELAEELGVTKSVVHFALKELEQLKFLRCVPRHGTYVNDWLCCGNFETLNAVLKLQGVNVDAELKNSLIQMRNVIESDAMQLCSQRCNEEDYAQLQSAIDKLAASPDDAGSKVHAELIREFHLLIVEKSGNLMYPIMMRAFSDFSAIIWERCVEFWSKKRVVELEQEQLDLIRAGKGEKAGEQIKEMHKCFLAGKKI